MFGFNRGFGWINRYRAGLNPPLTGLLQWLEGDSLIDKMSVITQPTISSGTITQVDQEIGFSEFWATNDVLVTKSIADQTGWTSGNGYVWILTIDGTVEEVLTYDHILSESEYEYLGLYLRYSSNDIIEILYDVNDSPIIVDDSWDDSLTWYDLLIWQEQSVVYVQP